MSGTAWSGPPPYPCWRRSASQDSQNVPRHCVSRDGEGLQPPHQAQLERMRQQRVARIHADAIIQPAAQLGSKIEREALLVRRWQHIAGHELVALLAFGRVAQAACQ